MRKRSLVLTVLGVLCLLAALVWTGLNLWHEAHAEAAVEQALPQLESAIREAPAAQEPTTAEAPSMPSPASEEAVTPDYLLNPEMEMPVSSVDGLDYIGILEIPAIGLKLPVASEWSYANLNIAPCRYAGSAYLDTLVILGHNYPAHFKELKSLRPGDAVQFTDADGNVFSYTVSDFEQLRPGQVTDMISGDWDLTLFTCTVGGQLRLAVRCVREEAAPAIS